MTDDGEYTVPAITSIEVHRSLIWQTVTLFTRTNEMVQTNVGQVRIRRDVVMGGVEIRAEINGRNRSINIPLNIGEDTVSNWFLVNYGIDVPALLDSYYRAREARNLRATPRPYLGGRHASSRLSPPEEIEDEFDDGGF